MSAPKPSPTIHLHPLSDPSSQATLQAALAHLHQPAYFQTALPLHRRLRFSKRPENTYLLASLSLQEIQDRAQQSAPEPSKPWLYAFVDRACRPETEVWFFGSWEIEPEAPPGQLEDAASAAAKSQSNSDQEKRNGEITALLSGLLETIKALPMPPSIHAENLAPDLPDPNIMLWGAIHERTLPFLQTFGLRPEALAKSLVGNYMFIFRVDALPEPEHLPSGLRWGKVESAHFPLVRSRTSIARQDRTLAILPSLAIYPQARSQATLVEQDPAPIAWAFVGLDSSLTTLHVEPSHRRLGLARSLTAKLFREQMDACWEEGLAPEERLAIGYVVEGNEASAGMCRSLGGKCGWKVYWVRIDIGKV